MDSHAALIARLEEAEEGSRELDYTIRMVLAGYEPVSADAARRADEDGVDPAPHYTTNLQDALDLVPGRAHWSVSYPVGEAELVYGGPNGRVVAADAATGALALVIASLKAMEAGDD